MDGGLDADLSSALFIIFITLWQGMDGFNENQMKQLRDLLAPVGNKLAELAQQTSQQGKTLNRLNKNVGKLIEQKGEG